VGLTADRCRGCRGSRGPRCAATLYALNASACLQAESLVLHVWTASQASCRSCCAVFCPLRHNTS